MSNGDERIGFYNRMTEMQDKLRKSEEERMTLEKKFSEMMRSSREEEAARLTILRHKYEKCLEAEKRRRERNAQILQTLDRIESRTSMITAKSERLQQLRKHYEAYLTSMYPSWPNNQRNPVSDILLKIPQLKSDVRSPISDQVLASNVNQKDLHLFPLNPVKGVYTSPYQMNHYSTIPTQNVPIQSPIVQQEPIPRFPAPQHSSTMYVPSTQNTTSKHMPTFLPSLIKPVNGTQEAISRNYVNGDSSHKLNNEYRRRNLFPDEPCKFQTEPTEYSDDRTNVLADNALYNKTNVQLTDYIGRAAELLNYKPIGNINDSTPIANGDSKQGISVDYELEQNTSGDILNMSLSDDGILNHVPDSIVAEREQHDNFREQNPIDTQRSETDFLEANGKINEEKILKQDDKTNNESREEDFVGYPSEHNEVQEGRVVAGHGDSQIGRKYSQEREDGVNELSEGVSHGESGEVSSRHELNVEGKPEAYVAADQPAYDEYVQQGEDVDYSDSERQRQYVEVGGENAYQEGQQYIEQPVHDSRYETEYQEYQDGQHEEQEQGEYQQDLTQYNEQNQGDNSQEQNQYREENSSEHVQGQDEYHQEQGQSANVQGRYQYEQGQGDYDQGQGDYDQGQGHYDQGQGDYEQGQSESIQGQGGYEQDRGDYNQGQGEYEHGQSENIQDQGEYDQGQGENIQGQGEYEQGQGGYNQDQVEYEQGQGENIQGRDEYEEGLGNYEQGQGEYEQGQSENIQGQGEYEQDQGDYDQGQVDYGNERDKNQEYTEQQQYNNDEAYETSEYKQEYEGEYPEQQDQQYNDEGQYTQPGETNNEVTDNQALEQTEQQYDRQAYESLKAETGPSDDYTEDNRAALAEHSQESPNNSMSVSTNNEQDGDNDQQEHITKPKKLGLAMLESDSESSMHMDNVAMSNEDSDFDFSSENQ